MDRGRLIPVVAAALVVDGRVLAARRSYPAAEAGGWEFPGGKLEPGESPPEALIRECREELGVEVVPRRQLASVRDERISLQLWHVTAVTRPAASTDHDELRWLRASELGEVAWLPIDRLLLREVAGLLTAPPP